MRSEGAERRDFYPDWRCTVPVAYRSPQLAGLPPTIDALTRGLAIPARRPESAGDAVPTQTELGASEGVEATTPVDLPA